MCRGCASPSVPASLARLVRRNYSADCAGADWRFACRMEQLETNSLFERIGGRAGLMQLLKHFYADVRQHNQIGPIFLAQIHDWPSHLEKIADFWSGATGGPARYAGPMPQRHFPLGLEPAHFEAWLDLWGRNCRARFAPAEADAMIQLAGSIGVRLRELVERFGEKSNDLIR